MRGKRSKQYRKLMQQYGLSFGFREPYQVLVDAGMIQDAARFKMRLGSMLERTLHGEIKPMITQCCIRHLYNAENGAEKDNWIEVAKQAERRRCGHHELEKPLSALECLMSVVDPKSSGTNRHRYVVASQELEVRRAMREITGVPLIYIARSVMILEPMAQRTEEIRESGERGKVRAGLKGRREMTGTKRKREDPDVDNAGLDEQDPRGKSETLVPRKKPKGPKGPNPLSVKKSKLEHKPVNDAATVQTNKDTRTKSNLGSPLTEMGVNTSAGFGEILDESREGMKKRKRKRKTKDSNDEAQV